MGSRWSRRESVYGGAKETINDSGRWLDARLLPIFHLKRIKYFLSLPVSPPFLSQQRGDEAEWEKATKNTIISRI